MFANTLAALRKDLDGVRAVLLASMDGMVVAMDTADDQLAPDAVAAAFADLHRKMRAAHQDVGLGDPQEWTADGALGRIAVRAVTPDYLLVALLAGHATMGRVRFELRKAAVRLEPELV